MSSAAARMPSPALVRVTNQPRKAGATPVSSTVMTLICVKVIWPPENWMALFIQPGMGKILRRAGEDQDAEILQDVGDGEAGEQQRDVRRPAHGPIGDPLRPSPPRARRDAAERGDPERHADRAEHQRREGAHHHHVAMREIRHAQDAEHHGEADRHQRVEAAEADGVDHLLADIERGLMAAPRDRRRRPCRSPP